MERLKGKNVLITGGTSGIGLASAKLFREQGARLVVTGRDEDRLAQTQDELGSDTLVVRSEAGNLAEIESLMEKVKNRFDRLDVLFLNAGLGNPAPIELMTEAAFDEVMAVNFKGIYFSIQKALPLFSSNASIIVTTSITNCRGAPNHSVYGATKAAQRSLVQSLGVALVGRGIRINAVCPGPIETDGFNRKKLPKETLQTIKNEIAERSPIKRFGTPEEVAKVALFLASDDSAYVVGEEIVVDGGISLTCLP